MCDVPFLRRSELAMREVQNSASLLVLVREVEVEFDVVVVVVVLMVSRDDASRVGETTFSKARLSVGMESASASCAEGEEEYVVEISARSVLGKTDSTGVRTPYFLPQRHSEG